MVELVQVLIQPDGDERFYVHAPWERKTFEEYGEAVEYALAEASKKQQSKLKNQVL